MSLTTRLAGLIGAAVLVLGLCMPASAQGQRGRRGAQTIAPAILARLNLTSEQQTKIRAAEDAFRARIQELANATPQERRQGQQEARRTYLSAVQAALTDEQKKKLDELQAQVQEYQRMGLGQMSAALAGIELSADQKTKLKEIGAKYQPEFQALRAPGGDRQATMQKQRELNQKVTQEVRAILTEEQLKQLPQQRRPNQ